MDLPDNPLPYLPLANLKLSRYCRGGKSSGNKEKDPGNHLIGTVWPIQNLLFILFIEVVGDLWDDQKDVVAGAAVYDEIVLGLAICGIKHDFG